MPLPRTLGALAPLLLLAGCATSSGADAEGDAPTPTPAPVLERAWSASGWQTVPTTWNERWWLAASTTTSGVGRGTTAHPGPYKAGDVQDGSIRDVRGVEGFTCGQPVLPVGGSLVVLVTTGPARGVMLDSERPDCTTVQVVDLATGRPVWQATLPSPSERPGRLAVRDGVVHHTRGAVTSCWGLEDGLRLSGEQCQEVPEERFLDAEGQPVAPLDGQEEVGRSADVVLLTGSGDAGAAVVRAHSLPDGRLLWTDTLDPDPLLPDQWRRNEAYVLSTSGRLLRAHYEYADDPARSVAVLSEVDPRTGEIGGEVGRVEGGLLLTLIGDVVVLAVDQEEGLRSQIAGFVVPGA
ncbi:MAG: hypothetical protein ACI379_13270 [Nocardioides sp.]|uniref:hypothetical protein n=1 Tax=Nocardioides sp. TaxID=35761 RepID=UPI003F0F54C4